MLDCLIKGICCGIIKLVFVYFNYVGVMIWLINWDKYDGFNFFKLVGDKFS